MDNETIITAIGIFFIIVLLLRMCRKDETTTLPPRLVPVKKSTLTPASARTISMVDCNLDDYGSMNGLEYMTADRDRVMSAEPVNVLDLISKEEQQPVNSLNEVIITSMPVITIHKGDEDKASLSGLLLQKTKPVEILNVDSDIESDSPDTTVRMTMTTNMAEVPYGENLEWSLNESSFDRVKDMPILARPAHSGHMIMTPSQLTSDLHGIYNDVSDGKFNKAIVESYGLVDSPYGTADLRAPVDYSLVHSQAELENANTDYVGKFTYGLEESMNRPVVEPELAKYGGPRFEDCYSDNPRNRAFDNYLGVLTPQQCGVEARAHGFNIFGMQRGEVTGGGKGDCWAGNGPGYRKHGVAGDCTLHGGNYLGGYESNAVYKW